MAVNFYLEKRTDKKGDAPIRVSVMIRGARLVTSTGYKIAPAKWDAAKQQVKRGCSNAQGITYAVINAYLLRISELFTAFENACLMSGRTLEKTALHDEYARNFGKGTAPEEKQLTFSEVWKIFVDEMGTQNQWTKATYQKFSALKNHVEAWNDGVSFDSFDEAGLNDFTGFMRDVLEMRNTTIGKQLSFLKWFLRWATGKGYNSQRAFLTFSPKLKVAPKKVVFLEWGELMKVYNYTVPANGTEVTLTDATTGTTYTKTVHDASALSKARDIFCFCCFTSLRFSDASNLKRSNIENGSMTITTIKTADTLDIELNKFALSILQKYDGVAFPNDKALPPMTNQRMNIYLKDLCELCGINQPVNLTYYKGNQRFDETLPKYALIGTHTGRRTFICNALMLGITPQIVMKWTGHSDYKSMKPYIDVTDAAKAKAMDKFNNLKAE